VSIHMYACLIGTRKKKKKERKEEDSCYTDWSKGYMQNKSLYGKKQEQSYNQLW
jgi:hypothetical protein